MSNIGVHSEVGKLRTVMVCRPGLAHQRLTPGNCKDLLFDDVLWVQEAQKDHYDFVLKMQERGVEVLDLHDTARRDRSRTKKRASSSWIDASRRTASVSVTVRQSIRPWLDEMPAKTAGRPSDRRHRDLAICRQSEVTGMLTKRSAGSTSCCRRFRTRCFSAIRRAGSTAASPSIRCSGRRASRRRCCSAPSTSSIRCFADAKIWWGDSDEDFTGSSLEGGDVMPIGKGAVLIGMGERTTRQAVSQVAVGAVQEQGGNARHCVR